MKVFKYATGQDVPEGAIYLCTKTETITENTVKYGEIVKSVRSNALVWHYFLIKEANDG